MLRRWGGSNDRGFLAPCAPRLACIALTVIHKPQSTINSAQGALRLLVPPSCPVNSFAEPSGAVRHGHPTPSLRLRTQKMPVDRKQTPRPPEGSHRLTARALLVLIYAGWFTALAIGVLAYEGATGGLAMCQVEFHAFIQPRFLKQTPDASKPSNSKLLQASPSPSSSVTSPCATSTGSSGGRARCSYSPRGPCARA